jgi:hypothetical protein
MTYANFTDLSGKPIQWDSANTAAIVPYPQELANPVAQTRLLSGRGASTVVLGTALATATALGLQTSAAALPVVQALSGPTTLAGANAYIVKGQSPEIEAFTIPSDVTAYSRVTWPDGSVVVVTGAPAAVAAAIVGAGGSGNSRLVLQAFVTGSTGAILGQISDSGITLTPTIPYVPGLGFWQWTLGGAYPSSYIVQADVFAGQISKMQAAQLGGAQFYVSSVALDRILGTGSVTNLGAAFGNWGATVARFAAGVYDITLDSAPQPAGCPFTCFPVVAGGSGADRAVDVAYTSATTCRVTIQTQVGVDTDTPFSFVLVAGDLSGSFGYQVTEPVYTVQVFSADA